MGISLTMHYANLPFSFSRDHSAILEAVQTYCRYIGVLALVSAPDPTDAAADGLHHRYASRSGDVIHPPSVGSGAETILVLRIYVKAKISSLGLKRRGAIETNLFIKVTTAHILVSTLDFR